MTAAAVLEEPSFGGTREPCGFLGRERREEIAIAIQIDRFRHDGIFE